MNVKYPKSYPKYDLNSFPEVCSFDFKKKNLNQQSFHDSRKNSSEMGNRGLKIKNEKILGIHPSVDRWISGNRFQGLEFRPWSWKSWVEWIPGVWRLENRKWKILGIHPIYRPYLCDAFNIFSPKSKKFIYISNFCRRYDRCYTCRWWPWNSYVILSTWRIIWWRCSRTFWWRGINWNIIIDICWRWTDPSLSGTLWFASSRYWISSFIVEIYWTLVKY